MDHFFQKQQELFQTGDPFVAVTLVDAAGSTPQHPGAKMLVTGAGLYSGTVGGGRVEAKAIELARNMLSIPGASDSTGESEENDSSTSFVDWSLQKDVGMTCGGRVKLFFERFNRPAWNVAVFGAGHVAIALARLLIGFDCRSRFYDPRAAWLEKLPGSSKLERIQCEQPAREVAGLSRNTFVLLMTQGHTTDVPVLAEALRADPPFPYVGVIGSKSKRAVMERELLEAGVPEDKLPAFYCPIGLPVGGNRPEEIAVSIAAQLLEVRDRTAAVTP